DRGHFDEAADALAELADDGSAIMAIARARLATSRGDAPAALAHLSGVEAEALAGEDDVLAATWLLHAARAHLRLGAYSDSRRRRVAEVEARLGRAGDAGGEEWGAGREKARRGATEALTVRGLAESFASRHEDAKATLERSVQVARSLGDPRLLSLALSSLAL